MDPFNQVKDDALETIQVIETIISQRKESKSTNSELTQDFENNYQELQEIYQDLEQALNISISQPSKFNLSNDEIQTRKALLNQINDSSKNLRNRWESVDKKLRNVTTMSNRISQDDEQNENPFMDNIDNGTQYQQQELIREQDDQLDDIHKTMLSLNQQAQMMGDELEDQGYMLDELDYDLDNTGNKLQRGMKRMNIFLERNKETASNWCIGILVVVLCILLVLLIIV